MGEGEGKANAVKWNERKINEKRKGKDWDRKRKVKEMKLKVRKEKEKDRAGERHRGKGRKGRNRKNLKQRDRPRFCLQYLWNDTLQPNTYYHRTECMISNVFTNILRLMILLDATPKLWLQSAKNAISLHWSDPISLPLTSGLCKPLAPLGITPSPLLTPQLHRLCWTFQNTYKTFSVTKTLSFPPS